MSDESLQDQVNRLQQQVNAQADAIRALVNALATMKCKKAKRAMEHDPRLAPLQSKSKDD